MMVSMSTFFHTHMTEAGILKLARPKSLEYKVIVIVIGDCNLSVIERV